jgi:isoprenylcysteine carboxyl methyltransferase (ICMT) family protein YpbQ
MADYIFPLMFTVFAIFSLALSKSKKNYQKLVEDNGQDFANKVNKYLKLGGYLLLICSAIWLGFNFLEN